MDSDEVIDKLPTIDFGKLELKQGSEEWNSVRDQVYKALEEYGAFEAILDGTSIPKQRIYEKLKEVFSLPLKSKIPQSEKSMNGYYWDPLVPLYERLTITHILSPGAIESISNTVWPNPQKEFYDLVHSYAKRLSELDEVVRRMIFDKLGLEKYWDDHMNSTNCGLSFFRYRVPNADEANVGIPAHTDKQISTILSQHVSGLQVMKKNGQWLDVKYSSPHSFIFLVNDLVTALTNGRLHNPFHRVIMGDNERYSIGFFTTFRGIIKVPEELVDEDHPLLYKPFDALKYLEFCRENLGAAGSSTLKMFCGV